MAVIEQRRAAGEIEIWLRERDRAVGRRMDRRAFGCRDIDAEMRRHRLAVVDALAAESAAQDSLRRPVEVLCEGGGVGVALARFANHRIFARDALQHLFRRRDEFLRQTVDLLDVVVARDRKDAQMLDEAVGIVGLDIGHVHLIVAQAERKQTCCRDADGLSIQLQERGR